MTKSQRNLTVASVMVGMLIASLDQTIVDTAFPKMISELGGVSLFTWVITAYMLASTAVVPVVGKLADMYGRKLFWLIGIAIFVIGSVLCGRSTNMTEMILFRAVQGIGGGMIMPIAQTIIGDVFTGEQRAKMQGLFTGVFALGSAIGPLVGGLIVDYFHWKYIFLINLPVGLGAVALAWFALPNGQGSGSRKIDWVGSLLSMVTVVSFLMAMQMGGGHWAWSSLQSIALFGTALVGLILFIINELKVEEPILDLSLFKNRTFTTFAALALLQGIGMFGAIIYVPWFIQGVVGVSATNSGTVSIPMTFAMLIGSVAGGQLARKLQYRVQLAGGLAVVIAGFYLATQFTIATSLWQARAAMMLIGLGLGLVMPLVTLGVQQAFDKSRRGVVTSATAFFRSMGGTIGVTTLGVIFNHQMKVQYDARIAPQLAQLPAQVVAGMAQIVQKPADLVQVLLQKQMQELIPEGIRPQMLQTVKEMMANSIHPVFWTGMGIIAVGILVGQFLGSESLTKQIAAGDGAAEKLEGGFEGAH